MSFLFRQSSLIQRLRRALLGLAVLPLLLGFGISLTIYVVSERAQLYEQYQRSATRVSEAIQSHLARGEDHLAQSQRFWNFERLTPSEQERVLRDILAAGAMFNAIDYLDPLGERRLRVSRRDFGETAQLHWREQEAVARTIAGEGKSYSRVEIDTATGEPSLILALPVRDQRSDRMVGILAAELSLKQVWRELGHLARGSRDDLFVISAERRVIAHVNPSTVLAGTRYVPPAEVGIHRDLEGRLALVAVSALQLPGNTLTTVLTRPLVSAFGVGLVQVGLALLLLSLSLALAWWLIRLMTRWLLDPMAELTRAAERIGADERAVRVQGRFEGEVATLAATFNLMLDRLHQEHALLEQRVAERTQALAQANQQAQQANRMLYAVLDTIPLRIFWKDRNLTYLGCNQLFARDAGKAGPHEVIGHSDDEMAWRAVSSLYRSDDMQVIASGQPKLNFEEPQTTTGGGESWLRTSKVPLRDAEGHIIGVLGTYEDITHEKQVAMELRLAKEAAEQANRAKSLFLSSMSHELRTPLNAILGYAQLLEMNTELPTEVGQSAQEILQAGRHLLELVNDILDLARVEAGRIEFHLEDLPLTEVLDDCLAQNKPRANDSGVTLQVEAGCAARWLRADRRRLLQVLNNLVSNAIKYNRRGGEVRIGCASAEGDRCRILVSDTGQGMNAGQLAQLFQPFNRVGAEMSRIEGTGIGLTITRQLVEGMGGTLGVQSTPGQGTTFWFELPACASDELPQPPQPANGERAAPASPLLPAPTTATPAPAEAARTPAEGRLRVLVAEDYGPNQTVLRLQLQSLGCEVDMAGDGAAALLKWRKSRHDLILTDLNMPVMDGLGLARAVRQAERELGGHVPIVAITAAVVRAELQNCLDAGMDDTLTKPIALDGLRAVIERWRGDARQAASVGVTPAASAPVQEMAATLDLDTLYQVLGQPDPALARELVASFLESAAAGLDELRAATPDPAALAREMHKQKSSARTVGALHYAQRATALEERAQAGQLDARQHAEQLDALAAALADVRAAHDTLLRAGAQDVAVSPPEVAADMPPVRCNSVLVVDDDVVVLRQVQSILGALGVPEVLGAANGMEAILTMSAHATELEVVVCDLNMPEMDGVELIRRFGQTGFKGALILMSGADAQLMNTVSRLAELQGLRVLGQLGKPVLPHDMAALLARLHETPQGGAAGGGARPVRATPEITLELMREAMARDEFMVWFQPKVDSLSLRPVGLESLARWRLPDGSFVPPDLFITLAEREGLIGELSRVLTLRALREAALVHEAGYRLKLAVNLSGQWLDDLQLPEIITVMVSQAGLQARDLVLEVTETGVMDDLTTALDVLTRLRLKGFGLSIDDFGIGYSSFEQLARIPFTEMKLDRSFVNKGSHDPAARAILESSMGMAQKLGLATVAEGVETQEDLTLVREIGCDLVQGYLVAKPMPVDELLVWLASQSRRSA